MTDIADYAFGIFWLLGIFFIVASPIILVVFTISFIESRVWGRKVTIDEAKKYFSIWIVGFFIVVCLFCYFLIYNYITSQGYFLFASAMFFFLGFVPTFWFFLEQSPAAGGSYSRFFLSPLGAFLWYRRRLLTGKEDFTFDNKLIGSALNIFRPGLFLFLCVSYPSNYQEWSKFELSKKQNIILLIKVIVLSMILSFISAYIYLYVNLPLKDPYNFFTVYLLIILAFLPISFFSKKS